MSPEERFWAKVDKSDECWLWTATKTKKGYGQVRYLGKLQYAHRVSAHLSGVDVTSATIDHICRNRSCVRPSHLRPVTSKQNSENLSGAHSDNPSGIRGVSWDKRNRAWQARVFSAGKQASKRFRKLEDAESWVRAKRLEMFTHNELDRQPQGASN